MYRNVTFGWTAVLAVLISANLGCSGSSGPVRVAVQGEVTFDGTPIDEGSITFLPIDANAIKTGGQIVDGKYDIPAEKGPLLGKHKVQIRWRKKTGETYVDKDTEDVYDKRAEGLPAIYQSDETPLKAEFVEDGDNVNNYNIKLD